MEEKENRASWHDILAFTLALYKLIFPPLLFMGAIFGLTALLFIGVWMK